MTMTSKRSDFQPGPPFDALLALTVFDWSILWLDVYGVGFHPYFWDKSAQKTEYGTRARLIGACWKKFNGQDVFVHHVPPWSTNRGVMWELIDRIRKEELDFYLYTSGGQWICELERYYVDDDESVIIETADTPEFAVCLATMELFR